MLEDPIDSASFQELLQENAWMASKKTVPSTPVKVSRSLPSTSTAEAEYMPIPNKEDENSNTSTEPGQSNTDEKAEGNAGGGWSNIPCEIHLKHINLLACIMT